MFYRFNWLTYLELINLLSRLLRSLVQISAFYRGCVSSYKWFLRFRFRVERLMKDFHGQGQYNQSLLAPRCESNCLEESREKDRKWIYRDSNAVFELDERWLRAEGALGEEGRPGRRRQPELRGRPGALRALRALQRLQLLHPPPQRAEKSRRSPINLMDGDPLIGKRGGRRGIRKRVISRENFDRHWNLDPANAAFDVIGVTNKFNINTFNMEFNKFWNN